MLVQTSLTLVTSCLNSGGTIKYFQPRTYDELHPHIIRPINKFPLTDHNSYYYLLLNYISLRTLIIASKIVDSNSAKSALPSLHTKFPNFLISAKYTRISHNFKFFRSFSRKPKCMRTVPHSSDQLRIAPNSSEFAPNSCAQLRIAANSPIHLRKTAYGPKYLHMRPALTYDPQSTQTDTSNITFCHYPPLLLTTHHDIVYSTYKIRTNTSHKYITQHTST